MKRILSAVLLALMMPAALAVQPADKSTPQGERKFTKQQMKMKNCSREAKEKKLRGGDRKSFMKSCLSGRK